MKERTLQPYLITSLGLIIIVLVAVVYIGVQLPVIQPTRPVVVNGNTVSVYTSKPDPFVTTVPVNQQTTAGKTKVFVSTLDALLGVNTAKVYVIIFGQLTDPTALQYLSWAKTLTQQPNVAVVWKDNVTASIKGKTVDANNPDVQVAMLAHCLNEQNVFWKYVDLLTQQTGKIDYQALATKVGADGLTMQQCLDDGGYAGQIVNETNYATAVGVTTTHSVFVNDQVFNNVLTQTELTDHVTSALAQK